MYQVLVVVHILSAMVWVGGGFVLVAVERRAYKMDGVTGANDMMKRLEWTDNMIFTPAPLLAVATGITMVAISEAWAFSQPWVYLALALIAIEFVSGYRDLARMKKAQRVGVESPQFRNALKAYLRFTPIAIGLLGVIVVLMVYKPGG
ncbi:MAG: DUF2269 family protein [Acidimicrobiia bacterium]